ncbi:unnamed protein product [Bursaphelenchus xylophilus]|uniref:(pine wood nematode) hypothetical protein n=1 Tax=Bursaphelenchus xylophilus TaxID=6326 RepID=A0A1I7S805_BURXY|nr:unnamed protein product [Bursaphelenchus xylophilus]CAG9087307.1 unnamed protein product [Bursaphelenchus xylophilus]
MNSDANSDEEGQVSAESEDEIAPLEPVENIVEPESASGPSSESNLDLQRTEEEYPECFNGVQGFFKASYSLNFPDDDALLFLCGPFWITPRDSPNFVRYDKPFSGFSKYLKGIASTMHQTPHNSMIVFSNPVWFEGDDSVQFQRRNLINGLLNYYKWIMNKILSRVRIDFFVAGFPIDPNQGSLSEDLDYFNQKGACLFGNRFIWPSTFLKIPLYLLPDQSKVIECLYYIIKSYAYSISESDQGEDGGPSFGFTEQYREETRRYQQLFAPLVDRSPMAVVVCGRYWPKITLEEVDYISVDISCSDLTKFTYHLADFLEQADYSSVLVFPCLSWMAQTVDVQERGRVIGALVSLRNRVSKKMNNDYCNVFISGYPIDQGNFNWFNVRSTTHFGSCFVNFKSFLPPNMEDFFKSNATRHQKKAVLGKGMKLIVNKVRRFSVALAKGMSVICDDPMDIASDSEEKDEIIVLENNPPMEVEDGEVSSADSDDSVTLLFDSATARGAVSKKKKKKKGTVNINAKVTKSKLTSQPQVPVSPPKLLLAFNKGLNSSASNPSLQPKIESRSSSVGSSSTAPTPSPQDPRSYGFFNSSLASKLPKPPTPPISSIQVTNRASYVNVLHNPQSALPPSNFDPQGLEQAARSWAESNSSVNHGTTEPPSGFGSEQGSKFLSNQPNITSMNIQQPIRTFFNFNVKENANASATVTLNNSTEAPSSSGISSLFSASAIVPSSVRTLDPRLQPRNRPAVTSTVTSEASTLPYKSFANSIPAPTSNAGVSVSVSGLFNITKSSGDPKVSNSGVTNIPGRPPVQAPYNMNKIPLNANLAQPPPIFSPFSVGNPLPMSTGQAQGLAQPSPIPTVTHAQPTVPKIPSLLSFVPTLFTKSGPANTTIEQQKKVLLDFIQNNVATEGCLGVSNNADLRDGNKSNMDSMYAGMNQATAQNVQKNVFQPVPPPNYRSVRPQNLNLSGGSYRDMGDMQRFNRSNISSDSLDSSYRSFREPAGSLPCTPLSNSLWDILNSVPANTKFLLILCGDWPEPVEKNGCTVIKLPSDGRVGQVLRAILKTNLFDRAEHVILAPSKSWCEMERDVESVVHGLKEFSWSIRDSYKYDPRPINRTLSILGFPGPSGKLRRFNETSCYYLGRESYIDLDIFRPEQSLEGDRLIQVLLEGAVSGIIRMMKSMDSNPN